MRMYELQFEGPVQNASYITLKMARDVLSLELQSSEDGNNL
jgi:hypothetical protein